MVTRGPNVIGLGGTLFATHRPPPDTVPNFRISIYLITLPQADGSKKPAISNGFLYHFGFY